MKLRILIAPDKFKGSMTALEASRAMKRGVLRALPSAKVMITPMADGGEGFLEAILSGAPGRKISVSGIRDALMRPRRIDYALLKDGTAVIELPRICGLLDLKPKERNPKVTTTFGIGQVMLHAVARGAKRILVGLGGSATNDGGAGLGQALGFQLLDQRDRELPQGGGALINLAKVIAPKRLKLPPVIAAADVTTRLCGPQGASAIYGPQKGASVADVRCLDAGLKRLSQMVPPKVANLRGSGAAGGTAFGLVAFAGGKIESGFDWVARVTDLETKVREADLVLTGEGSVDEQTAEGKGIARLAELAKKYRKPIVAFGGRVVGTGLFTAEFALAPRVATVEESIRNAERWLEDRTYEVVRLWSGKNSQ